MTKRAKRERQEKRKQAQASAPATGASSPSVEKGPARTPTAPGRASTFEVAAAHRQLADALPSLVHQRSKAPAARKTLPGKPSQASAGDRPQDVGQTSVKSAAPRAEKAGLKIEKPPQTACKAKPARTSGDGRSRPYVPWCR